MVGSSFDNVRQSLKCAVKCSQMLSGSTWYRSPGLQPVVSLLKVNKQTALDIGFFSKSNFTSSMSCSHTFSLFGLWVCIPLRGAGSSNDR